jgi:hypothetical protein
MVPREVQIAPLTWRSEKWHRYDVVLFGGTFDTVRGHEDAGYRAKIDQDRVWLHMWKAKYDPRTTCEKIALVPHVLHRPCCDYKLPPHLRPSFRPSLIQ